MANVDYFWYAGNSTTEKFFADLNNVSRLELDTLLNLPESIKTLYIYKEGETFRVRLALSSASPLIEMLLDYITEEFKSDQPSSN